MNKKLKLVKAILSASLLVTPFSLLFIQHNNVASAHNDKLLEKNKEHLVINNNNYKILFDDIYNIYIKTDRELSDEELEVILSENNLNNQRAVSPIEVFNVFKELYDKIYEDPYSNVLEQNRQLKGIANGWAKVTIGNVTKWFYLENYQKKRGWHWDSYYNGWYFFDIEGVMYDPRNRGSSWIRKNNKWYEFEIGGKLIQHEGWRPYNGKYLYHIPGDYGAVASTKVRIDGVWYTFDENGYSI